ncbi:pilus biogenesis protein, partial [Clostridium sartagoforme AAU1]
MNIFNFEMDEINIETARKLNKYKAIENKSLPINIKEDFIIVLSSEDVLENKEEVEFLFNKKIKIIKESKEFILDLIEKIFLGEREELFEIILAKAISLNASDIHFEPQEEDIFIRFRVDWSFNRFYKD